MELHSFSNKGINVADNILVIVELVWDIKAKSITIVSEKNEVAIILQFAMEWTQLRTKNLQFCIFVTAFCHSAHIIMELMRDTAHSQYLQKYISTFRPTVRTKVRLQCLYMLKRYVPHFLPEGSSRLKHPAEPIGYVGRHYPDLTNVRIHLFPFVWIEV